MIFAFFFLVGLLLIILGLSSKDKEFKRAGMVLGAICIAIALAILFFLTVVLKGMRIE